MFTNSNSRKPSWFEWANNYNKSYWKGYILKAVLRIDLGVKVHTRKLVIVFNSFSNNYFHWFTEVLPKIIYLINLDKDYCFLFPDAFKQDYQISTLKSLKVNVLFFSKSILYFKNINFFSGFSEHPGYYEPKILLATRSVLLELEKNNTPNFAEELVYVSRKKAMRRKVSNEDELESVLVKFNFKIYYFDDLSFAKIIEISKSAKVLVSIHGAALTNMIFMNKGSIVFELMKQNVVIDKCYYFLANALGIQYYYQTCQTHNQNESHIFSDISVDKKIFEQNIKSILNTF